MNQYETLHNKVTNKFSHCGSSGEWRLAVHDEVLLERTSVDFGKNKRDVQVSIISKVNCDLARRMSRRLNRQVLLDRRTEAGVANNLLH